MKIANKIVSKIVIVLILSVVSLQLQACGNKKSDSNIIQNDIQNSENISGKEENEKAESEILPREYKIPGKSVYMNVPNFKELEKGYTQVFADFDREYVGIVCEYSKEINDLPEAHEDIYEIFKNTIQSLVLANDLTVEQDEYTTINEIDVYKYVGTINCGYSTFTDKYVIGYVFIIDKTAYGIIGVADVQEQEVIDEITTITDEIMKTVRTEE